MTHIVFPMSGPNLFDKDEFFYPKPLIEIAGIPMIERVLAPFKDLDGDFKFHFLVNKKDCDEYALDNILSLIIPNCNIVPLAEPTQGAPCTTTLLIDKLPDDEPIIICNADCIFERDLNTTFKELLNSDADAAVLTFNSIHPRWSFVRTEGEYVIETAEKRPISRHAIAGTYYFKRFDSFISATMDMIRKDIRVNNAFYLSLTLNELILANKRVSFHEIDKKDCHIIHSPTILKEFERSLQRNPS